MLKMSVHADKTLPLSPALGHPFMAQSFFMVKTGASISMRLQLIQNSLPAQPQISVWE